MISRQRGSRLILCRSLIQSHLGVDKALIFDIGGGSTEAVLGDRQNLLFQARACSWECFGLLDMFERQGPVGSEGCHLPLKHSIQAFGPADNRPRFESSVRRVIGTSGSIRTLGEAGPNLLAGRRFLAKSVMPKQFTLRTSNA